VAYRFMQDGPFAHIPISYKEKRKPKTKTDLSFVAVYILCNYCQGPKP